jgi:thiol-disulfide isomerase/thioredoxin
VILIVLLIATLTNSTLISKVSSQSPTHSVFVEIFTSTWCEPCQKEQSLIKKMLTNDSHIAHFIVYHLQDIWSTTDSVDRANQLDFNFVPSHAYDGGYSRTSGSTIDPFKIETLSFRNVHLIELTVTKAINGNSLTTQISIAERNGYSFSGDVAVYAVEDRVFHNGTEWYSVYRDQIFRQGIFLKPNSYQVLSGNWTIPESSMPENIEVIAVTFDKTTSGKYGIYAVQSACSRDSELAIPEFGTMIPIIVASTILIAFLAIKRNNFRKNKITLNIQILNWKNTCR